MSTVTFHLPSELHDKIEAIALHKGISLDALFLETTKAVISAHDAEKRYLERSSRGAGREAEALALIDRG